MITRFDTPRQAMIFSPNSEMLLNRYEIEPRSNFNSLEDEAQKRGVNTDFLVQLINSSYEPTVATVTDFEKYSVLTLVDYLERSHRHYLQKRLPEMEQTIAAMRCAHCKKDPIYVLLSRFFTVYSEELEQHFSYEEQHLFPYAKLLHRTGDRWRFMPALKTFLSNYSTTEFLANHSDTEIELKEVRKALLNYTPPADNQLPFHVLLDQLKSLEQDLHLHGLIEDRVLIPKLAVLEKMLNED